MTNLAFLATCFAGACATMLPRADIPTGAPALPLSAFNTMPHFMSSPEELVAIVDNGTQHGPESDFQGIQATCSSSRTRQEWHSTTDATKQKFIDAIKCMLNRPSKGNYPGSHNRYEDFVQVHQTVANNVHNNAKFLPWHRAYLWAFEEALRGECGYTESIPWFDETLYPGRFSQSSIFSSKWLGAINVKGQCVTDGQFANLALNIGPGTGNQYHCLTRNGDAGTTALCTADNVEICQRANDYQVFETCEERGLHAYGHIGTGGEMNDFFASPNDPVFWLHHGMVDRHFRIWQNDDGNRVNYIDGVGPDGKALTMDTTIYLNGLKPDVKIRDVMNTLGGVLCYRYDY
jgi:tyrosinase